MIIKLVRHGQSIANANKEYKNGEFPDHKIELTDKGIEQAHEAGTILGRQFITNALIYCSPYTRTRATLQNILLGAKVDASEIRIYEDPRLREVEHGYKSFDEQESMISLHGLFFYRFDGGESPADCYDRMSTFLESLRRQSDRKGNKTALIVTHGLTIRCFVTRFLHLSVEDFEQMTNPWNGSIVTIAKRTELENPIFQRGEWGVEGIKLKDN